MRYKLFCILISKEAKKQPYCFAKNIDHPQHTHASCAYYDIKSRITLVYLNIILRS